MAPAISNRLRETAKRIPPLDFAAGLLRYAQYRHRLRNAERLHDPASAYPPPHLRYRVHNAFDLPGYIAVGKAVAAAIAGILRTHALDLDGQTVLDLGCGPGRVARWVKEAFPGCDLHGSDIDPEAIAWAQAHMAGVGRFSLNPPTPPTGFDDGMFDFVYCISLFTHLDEAMQDAWLDELRRIVKPGGHVLATTHGRHALASCTPAERATIERDGFLFRAGRKGRLKLDGLPEFYQTSFHSRAYVERRWGRHFGIVAHDEGGIGGHQDMLLMRRA